MAHTTKFTLIRYDVLQSIYEPPFLIGTIGCRWCIHRYVTIITLKAIGSKLKKPINCLGTPHTSHYENALQAIKAGKHVLCEKPITCNVAELHSLIAAAKEHNVFLMEALWTRFQPLSLEVKRIAEGGSLGPPVLLHADLSGNFDIHSEYFGFIVGGRNLML